MKDKCLSSCGSNDAVSTWLDEHELVHELVKNIKKTKIPYSIRRIGRFQKVDVVSNIKLVN